MAECRHNNSYYLCLQTKHFTDKYLIIFKSIELNINIIICLLFMLNRLYTGDLCQINMVDFSENNLHQYLIL